MQRRRLIRNVHNVNKKERKEVICYSRVLFKVISENYSVMCGEDKRIEMESGTMTLSFMGINIKERRINLFH